MANTKISAEASAVALTGTELILGVQSGANVKILASQLVALVSSSSVSSTGMIADSMGYLGVPIDSKSADYTVVGTDDGRCKYHPPSDTTARTWTIDSNANLALPVGFAVTFDNDFGAGAVTATVTTDTLSKVGTAGTTGSIVIAPGEKYTFHKVSPTRWRAS